MCEPIELYTKRGKHSKTAGYSFCHNKMHTLVPQTYLISLDSISNKLYKESFSNPLALGQVIKKLQKHIPMGKAMYFSRAMSKQEYNSAADNLLIKSKVENGHPKYPCGRNNARLTVRHWVALSKIVLYAIIFKPMSMGPQIFSSVQV